MLRRLTSISAWFIYLAVVVLYVGSLWALLAHRADETFWSLSETFKIVQYSSIQAGLSALLATLLGLLTARGVFYLNFRGKRAFLRLLSFAWALPSLVVIFALIGVWGNRGWLSQLLGGLGINWEVSLYGLQGIILAHLFLNVPLVMRYCLEGLHLIPSHQHRLAAQLNLRGWHYFRIVELPMLKGILPYAFTTVFLLCFTSFPIVLMLGGSPKYSTLEVAIYQAVTFEFDFAKAAGLIMLQMVLGMLLQLVMTCVTRKAFQQRSATVGTDLWRPQAEGIGGFCLKGVLVAVGAMTLLPIMNVIWAALSVPDLWQHLGQALLWQSLGVSLILSLIASLTAVGAAYVIALEARQQAYAGRKIRHHLLAGVTTYPLILPVFLLAVGLFLLLMESELHSWQLMLLVGLCTGLTLLPFVYLILYPAMWKVLTTQDRLARSLGLSGFNRWWIVEKKPLMRPLVQAFALSMSAGLGNFSLIAFFGSPDFATLPYLLYQQLGSYRTQEAAVTALCLMCCALLPFLFIKPSEIR